MQNSWIQAVARRWRMRGLREPYRSLLDQDDGLLVSIDCETTSLNVKEAELLSIAAVCIDGRRLCTRDAFYALITPQHAPDGQNVRVHGLRPCDFSTGLPLQDVLSAFLQFVRGRTLVGYYLQYDLAVLNKNLRPLMGAALPNSRIEVSGRYYDWRFAQYPGAYIDLRWETIGHRNLRLPTLPRHDAMNDAITAAMMYLALQSRGYGAHRLP
jgi:DNA polymerase III, epsilon subunit and related 3''-5'' exonucleases